MTLVEIGTTAGVPDPLADASALAGLPDAWKAHILRYGGEDDRRRSLCAWRLLERLLCRCGIDAASVVIGDNGKPVCAGVYVSLSHSGERAAAVVSEQPVGCDIERVRRAPERVVRRLSEAERAYLADGGPGERDRRFFRMWTMRESYVKMTGEGVSALWEVEVDPRGKTVRRVGETQFCHCRVHDDGAYVLSVCGGAIGPSAFWKKA